MPKDFEQRDDETFEQWWERVNAAYGPNGMVK